MVLQVIKKNGKIQLTTGKNTGGKATHEEGELEKRAIEIQGNCVGIEDNNTTTANIRKQGTG